jgi:hypothetical protein
MVVADRFIESAAAAAADQEQQSAPEVRSDVSVGVDVQQMPVMIKYNPPNERLEGEYFAYLREARRQSAAAKALRRGVSFRSSSLTFTMLPPKSISLADMYNMPSWPFRSSRSAD